MSDIPQEINVNNTDEFLPDDSLAEATGETTQTNTRTLTPNEIISEQAFRDIRRQAGRSIRDRNTTLANAGIDINQPISSIAGPDLLQSTENLGADIRQRSQERQAQAGVTNETQISELIGGDQGTRGRVSSEQVAAGQRTEEQAINRFSQAGQTAASNFQTGIGGLGGTPTGGIGPLLRSNKKIPCTNCTGTGGNNNIIVKTSGRLFSKLTGLLQRSFSITLPTNLVNYIKERLLVSKQVALVNCNTCNNTREMEDPSDDSDRYQQVVANLQAEIPKISENEALLGGTSGCGNEYCLWTGDVVHQFGLVPNDLPSYRVDPCGAPINGGIFGENIDFEKAGMQVPGGGRCNHVQGLNPPAVPGGTYTLFCGNKCNIVAGAQGFNLTTGGEVNMTGGITKISGPEVTVGSEVGRVAVAGESLVLTGKKSVELGSEEGHVYSRSTISTPANLIVGGHGHLEGASVVKLSTTGRNESTKSSAGSNIYGGPAFWGGAVPEGIIAGAREVASFATMSISHPEQVKTALSLRRGLGLVESLQTMAYSLRTLEFVPTGLSFTLFIPGLMFNFPHVHAIPDGAHVHDVRVPDIDYTSDSAKELRKKFTNVSANAPLPEYSTKATDVLIDIFSVIFLPFQAIGAALQHNTFFK